MAEPCGDDRPNRLGECEVCGSGNAQYKCPRCEVKTCCLSCVKIHKKELKCGGDREKTAFIPMAKFDSLAVLSDYRFLEDISKTVDNCKRNPLKRFTRYNNPLPPHLYRLKTEAMKRKTRIQFLPQHFTRRRENTTFLHFASHIIYWKVEFVFPQAGNIKIIEGKCDEDDRLSTILSKYIEFENCPDLYKSHLKFYHSCGLAGLEVLLQAENVTPSPSFFVFDMHSTLKENLENRLVIEHPVLYIIQKSHKGEYNILDLDLELQVEHKEKMTGFKPFHYYDTISYSNDNNTTYAKAAASIHSSANELRKYFGFVDESNDLRNKSEPQVISKKKRQFNIPQYDDLVKQ